MLQVNNIIASMVHQEILRQTSIEGVTRSIIDEICKQHREQFINSEYKKCMKRDDMTLLVRLFNIELGGQTQSSQPEKYVPFSL